MKTNCDNCGGILEKVRPTNRRSICGKCRYKRDRERLAIRKENMNKLNKNEARSLFIARATSLMDTPAIRKEATKLFNKKWKENHKELAFKSGK